MVKKTTVNILVVVAHADDEVLGCGATIAKHIANGDNVSLLVMADGVNSRLPIDSTSQKARNNALEHSCEILGISTYQCLNFPDNQLDTIAMLTLTQSIEKVIEQCKPQRIYTHFSGDLNIDHQRTFQAVITATRPQPDHCVKSILCFEVPSSSEWHFQQHTFQPNFFNDVSGYEKTKIKALAAYQEEMRAAPHVRSIENITHLMQIRGATVGCYFAEAFTVARITE